MSIRVERSSADRAATHGSGRPLRVSPVGVRKRAIEARKMRLRRYGLTEERFAAMLAEQGGRCAICMAPPEVNTRLDIDHCHTTGAVRGLLCVGCNTAMGKFRDDPDLLERVVAYLRRHQAHTTDQISHL